MDRELMAPIAVTKRHANELPLEEMQAECLRYSIPSGDAPTRTNALQHRYDEEYATGQQEHEEYLRKLEEAKRKEEFLDAVHNLKTLEQQALEREPKVHAIVREIEQNIAPKHLVVRALSQLACCALLRAMRTNTSVRSLDLSNNKLTDAIGESLGKMLEKNTRLVSLNVGFNELTSQSLGTIGDALKVNSALTSLALESNPIMLLSKEQHAGTNSGPSMSLNSSGSGGNGKIDAFTSAIAMNSTLTALNVFSTHMNYDVGRALAQAFVKNTSIVSLEVGGNSLLQSDIALISNHLRKNQSRMEAAQAKSEKIHSEVKMRAEEVRIEQATLAKQQADEDWHAANAKKRAEIREQEDWERARIKAEEEVRRLVEIEALDKKYREKKLEAETKPKGAKGKK